MGIPVADIHAHPGLKTFVLPRPFRRRFSDAHRATGAWNPFGMRSDLPSNVAGRVRTLVSALYVPERDLFSRCFPLGVASILLPRIRSLARRPYRSLIEHLDRFEEEVKRAREKGGAVGIARDLADLDRIHADGRLAVLHAVEGGHHLLDRHHEPDRPVDEAAVLANLDEFHRRGVCMLTPAHFFDNGIAPSAGGIPDDMFPRRMGCWPGGDLGRSLTPVGVSVVRRMLDVGMLVDMTHCTRPARARILDEAGDRPVVMSHVGARELCDREANPTVDEVRRIADGGGVVGVILMNYWLTTRERGHDRGLDLVLRTIDLWLREAGEDVVAIGSDFDGLTDPPDDLAEPSDLPVLVDELRRRYGPTIAGKIARGNFERVLRAVWQR